MLIPQQQLKQTSVANAVINLQRSAQAVETKTVFKDAKIS